MFFATDPPRRSDADTAVRRVINVFARVAGKGSVFLLALLAMPVFTASAADNAPPVITVPADKTYEQGEAITAFGITVTDADADTVTVTVKGLPSGLSYANGQVTGTVAADAAAQAYTVTISADDGVNTAVTATYTVTVTEADRTAPTVTISGPTAPRRGTFLVRFAFSEPVTGFEQGDVTVGNGFVREFSGSGAKYRAKIRITPGFSGTVTVDVAANVAADTAGNPNTAASRFSVEGDQTRPTVTISGPAGLQKGPFDVTFTFTESVTGFEKGDVTVGNGSVTSFSGSGRSYTATIAPAGAGTVTVDVAAQVAKDAPGNPNMPASRFSVQAEPASSNAPPEITDPGDKSYEQGEAIAAFGITVTDADSDPVTVTLTGLPSGLSYTSGQVQGTVAADTTAQAYTVTISADDGVNSAVTETFTITVTEADQTLPADQTPPTVTISGPTAPRRGTFLVRFAFSEPVTGFEQGDVTVGNGFVREFSGSGAKYRAKIRITPGFSGTVTVDVAANVAADAAGNPNTAASRFSVEGDQTRPTVTISGPAGLQKGPFDLNFTFSESVTGFEKGDVTVGNGSVTSFSGSGQSYTATIAPAGAGTVTVDVAAQVAKDAPGNPNMPASRFSVQAEPASSNAPPEITDPGDKSYEQGEAIAAFGITVTDADSDPVTVTLTGLPSGLSYTSGQVQGTVAADTTAQDYTVTITADDGVNTAVTAAFTVTVTEPAPSNAAPVITNPGAKTYELGETITSFGITVTDADSDPVTVTVTGLPPGLSYTNGEVQGTVAADAAVQDYTVTITANDGVNAAVTATFTVTVTGPTPANAAPEITNPGAKTYELGETITSFGITVTDADSDPVTVTVTGLPPGLSYTNGEVQGTVAADAAVQDYTVTISADDGVNAAATATFTVAVTPPLPTIVALAITLPRNKIYWQGEQITAFGITATAPNGDPVTVTVTGLPPGLSYTNGEVQGTVAAHAAAQDYTVTITADDGVNAAVTATFTIKVIAKLLRRRSALGAPTVAISGPTTV